MNLAEANLDAYRVPDYTFRLLYQWGKFYMIGAPRLTYGAVSPSCSQYIAPGYPEERPKLDIDELDRLTAIIDAELNAVKTEALKCRFRYEEKGKPWKRKRSARHLGVTVDDYLTLLRGAMRQVDVLMNGE